MKLKVLYITDIHADSRNIKYNKSDIESADLIIIGGDITNFGKRNSAEKIIEEIRSINNNLYAITGNCDYHEVDEYLEEIGLNFHGKIFEFKGIKFLGLKGSLTTPFNTPNEHSEEFYEKVLDSVSSVDYFSSGLVLISHQPPFNTLCDRLSSQMQVGSKVIKRFIGKDNIIACLTGHVHEARAIDKINNTEILNPGPYFNNNFGIMEIDTETREVNLKLN